MAMQFEYEILNVDEPDDSFGFFTSDVQIAGIIPGQQLRLDSSRYSVERDFRLKVVRIESCILAPDDAVVKVSYRVFCERVKIQ